ncbi:MAG: NAD-binding protein [Rhodobacteraceae bacterium]|nr:NAD-binding protein [Paracoccaceae bacterium]
MATYKEDVYQQSKEYQRQWRRSAFRSAGLVLLTLVVCTVGLAALDDSHEAVGPKLLDGLWNTMNMITTLGSFGHLDDGQKLFLICAMLTAIAVVSHAFSELRGLISSAALAAIKENRRMVDLLEQLNAHVIVMGFGQLGKIVARRLQEAGETVLIVDRDPTNSALASNLGYLVVETDIGHEEDAIKRLGLDKAKAIVVTTEDQDRKIAVTLIVHTLNPKVKIVSTGANRDRANLLHRAGASEVVVADELVAGELIHRLNDKGLAGGEAAP